MTRSFGLYDWTMMECADYTQLMFRAPALTAPRTIRHLATHLALLACVAVSLAAAPPPADKPDLAAGRTIAARGSVPERPGCAACHGLDGAGQPDVGIPRLAGLSADYVLDQLNYFAAGQRRNAAMAPFAQALTPAQRQQVAAYFASLPVPMPRDPVAAPESLIAAGRGLYLDGDFRTGLLGCAQCHGPTGLGVGDFSPRLAGQSAAYVTEQLTAWRSGHQRDPKGAFMHAEASHLTPADIAAVAAFVGSMSSAEESQR